MTQWLISLLSLVMVSSDRGLNLKPAASQVALAENDTIATCDDLMNIEVGGQDFTDIAKTVCNFWPTDVFGTFPVTTVSGLVDVLDVVFDENGVWGELQDLYTQKRDEYCLRGEVHRTVIAGAASETNTCPPTLDEGLLVEMPEVVTGAEKEELLTGNWACADGAQGSCSCTRRDQPGAGAFPVVEIASRPSGCQMVHSGTCYGACPRGHRPTFLTGWFRPVCTSVCGATNHKVTCGVGCANSRSSCAMVILNQVKEVTIAASQVVAFLTTGTAGLILAQTVEQVVRVAEWAFNVLSRLLQVIDVAYKQFTREQAEMATLIAIFQTVQLAIGDIFSDWTEYSRYVTDAGNLFLQLIDAQWGWIVPNLGWITGVLMQNGVAALTGAFEVAKAFAYGACDIADDTVSHVVEDVGDQRLVGPWTHDGNYNGKPLYHSLVDRANTKLEWNRYENSWSFWVYDTSFGRGWWFWWIGLGWRELYQSFAATPGFPTTGWRRVEGSLPLPLLVSATNGGQPSEGE